MKRALLLLASMCGCGTTQSYHPAYHPAKIHTPSGRIGFAIVCRDDVKCWEWASYSCPEGYDIIDTHATNGWSFSANNTWAGGGSKHSHTMIVECK